MALRPRLLRRADRRPPNSIWASGVDHQLVYRVIRANGPVRPQQVFEGYAEIADEPSTRQMVTRYRDKLDEYGLVEEASDGWVAVDETLEAPLQDQRMV